MLTFKVLYVISPALCLHFVHWKFCFVDRRWLYGEKLRINSQSAGKFSHVTITSEKRGKSHKSNHICGYLQLAAKSIPLSSLAGPGSMRGLRGNRAA